MTAPGGRLIQAEIAARYGVSEAAVRLYRRRPEWPAPSGKRGRHQEFDAGEVAAAMHAITARPASEAGADPEELLDIAAAAGEAGISHRTIRADISRGRWPQPDDTGNGVKRWKRSTVITTMRARQRYRRGGSGDKP